jgi:hypothetical protein
VLAAPLPVRNAVSISLATTVTMRSENSGLTAVSLARTSSSDTRTMRLTPLRVEGRAVISSVAMSPSGICPPSATHAEPVGPPVIRGMRTGAEESISTGPADRTTDFASRGLTSSSVTSCGR